MNTWLETGPAWMNRSERDRWRETLARVIGHLEQYFPDDQADYLAQAGGDRAYSFWLRLVDEQLAQLPIHSDQRPTFPWRDAYETGWPPRQAACTAWSGIGERFDVLGAINLPPKLPEAAQHPEPGRVHG